MVPHEQAINIMHDDDGNLEKLPHVFVETATTTQVDFFKPMPPYRKSPNIIEVQFVMRGNMNVRTTSYVNPLNRF